MRFGVFILGVVIALVVLIASFGPYTEYLWFLQDARQPQVFAKMYETQGLLFVVGFIAALCIFYFNLRRALKLSMVYLDRPATVSEVLVSRGLGAVQQYGPTITKIAATLLALLYGSGLAHEWNTYLLWSHGQPFGKADPIFGLDLSFFAFNLPWQLAVINFLFGLLLLTSILTFALYTSLQSAAAIARIELGRPAVKSHLSALFGVTVLVFGIQTWLRRYEYGLIESGQFNGAGYAAIHQLPIQSVIAWVLMAAGLLGIIAAFWQNGIRPAIGAVVLSAILYLGGMVAYPAILQTFVVNPDKLHTESPYASQAIAMTRYAYSLDFIDDKPAHVQAEPSVADVNASKGTLDNMRLWDPELLRKSLVALQGLKPYYTFNDVDIDRYRLGGHQQMVMIAPRDIYPSGLTATAQNWINTRLQYTHGFGCTVSPVNTVSAGGQPELIVRDIPPVGPPEMQIGQPRIYFSDFRDAAGQPENSYVLVDSKVSEFDYPAEGNDQYYRWTGNRGVEVGSFFSRLAFSFSLADFNILISPNVVGTTRLLFHRSIVDRAKLIYPFLNFDNDPYVVIFQGRLLWILDGYTSTDRIPYSAKTSFGAWEPNYIRNPVKVVVDAYSGETNAYAIDANEPLLRTYERIYPGLIKDRSALPSGLEAHFRYPEDLFHAQAFQLTQYHVTDPIAFLNNEDAWDMPTERGLSGGEEPMRPYYVQMRLPDEPADEFLLILPFTPRQKGNMSGWLAAHCDPQSYGRMKLYEYPRGTILPGPKQMEANFNQSPAIANLNTLLKNAQSEVIVGNLLVVPLGNSMMYVEPMFLESRSQGITAIPELKKVVLALADKIVVADSYSEALKELFGGEAAQPAAVAAAPTAAPTPTKPGAGSPTVSQADIQEAARIADEADKALRSGDLAKYGQLWQQLHKKLQQMAGH